MDTSTLLTPPNDRGRSQYEVQVQRTVKRIFDICISVIGLILTCPIWGGATIAVWLQDFSFPLYIAPRIGLNGKLFNMIKLRSMVVNADLSGVDSTSASDERITKIGRLVRKYKIDEITQLWNVLTGDMSLVGPRPNVKRETDLYTNEERKLLSVKPGITDISSIVFSDLNDLLRNSTNPNLDYNQLVRPWKSRLGLIYVANYSISLDIKLILLTVIGLFSRKVALAGVQTLLKSLRVNEQIINIAKRQETLSPFPPPGATEIVAER